MYRHTHEARYEVCIQPAAAIPRTPEPRPPIQDVYGQDTEAGGVSDGVMRWSWMMAMQASPKATLDCVDAFGRTDLRPDMDAFNVPTLVVHGTGDATVPIDATGRAAAKAIGSNAELKEYDGAPHGLIVTHAEQLNKDLLAFLNG
ncbi:alpha/beta fold hydrolase [Salinisphaera aquimarina]